jgi:hypothetical protein
MRQHDAAGVDADLAIHVRNVIAIPVKLFHRFQMATWTLVLSLVFIKGVYENLAMPEFNTTLMGLLGLSAGTYLGLKIPEASAPKK